MDILLDIDKSRDMEAVMEMVVDKRLLSEMTTVFPGCNKRVLVSSILLKNFREFYEIDDDTFASAQVVARDLLAHRMSDEYDTFFRLFNKWRMEDITKLKKEIETAKVAVLDVRENDPRDEADEQWNTGIDGSVELMDKRLGQLDDFSHSPPSQ